MDRLSRTGDAPARFQGLRGSRLHTGHSRPVLEVWRPDGHCHLGKRPPSLWVLQWGRHHINSIRMLRMIEVAEGKKLSPSPPCPSCWMESSSRQALCALCLRPPTPQHPAQCDGRQFIYLPLSQLLPTLRTPGRSQIGLGWLTRPATSQEW